MSDVIGLASSICHRKKSYRLRSISGMVPVITDHRYMYVYVVING